MQLPFNEMDPESRIWIYQSDRALSDEEVTAIRNELDNFIPDWTAHSKELKASGAILHNRFLVLAVDESHSGASGCSIDKSVALVKKIEYNLNLNFFDRMQVCYKDAEGIECFPLMEFRKLWESGKLNEDTPVFNNLVNSKAELDENWIQPLSKTWLAKRIPQT